MRKNTSEPKTTRAITTRNTSDLPEGVRYPYELSEEKAKQTVKGLWAVDPRNPISLGYKGDWGTRARFLTEIFLRPSPRYLGKTEDGTPIQETWNQVLARFIGERMKEDSPWFCPNCGALLALCQCPATMPELTTQTLMMGGLRANKVLK